MKLQAIGGVLESVLDASLLVDGEVISIGAFDALVFVEVLAIGIDVGSGQTYLGSIDCVCQVVI